MSNPAGVSIGPREGNKTVRVTASPQQIKELTVLMLMLLQLHTGVDFMTEMKKVEALEMA